MADANIKTDLGSMTRAELEDYIRSIGESRFRAAQIAEWLRRGVDFARILHEQGGVQALGAGAGTDVCADLAGAGVERRHRDLRGLVLHKEASVAERFTECAVG